MNPALPRHLAAVFTHKTTSCPRHQDAFGACAEDWSCSQRGKELSESSANNNLYWNDTGLLCNVGHPLTCSSGQYSAAPCLFPPGCKLAVQDFVTTLGDADRRHFGDSTRLTSTQASATVEQQLYVVSSMADRCLVQLLQALICGITGSF